MAYNSDNEPRYVVRNSDMSDRSSSSRNFLKQPESPSLSSDNRSSVPRVPPPPPPYVAQFSEYESIHLSGRKNWIMGLSLLMLIFVCLIFAAGGVCYSQGCEHCGGYYSAIWVGLILFVNSMVGLVTACKRSQNWFIALALMSTLGLVASSVLLVISIMQWREIDVVIDGECVIKRYDASYIRYIYENMNQYKDKFNFVKCYQELQAKVHDARISATLGSIIALLGALEGAITLVVLVLALRIVCKCGIGRSIRM